MSPGKVRPRENWYRDLWLLLISGVVLLALVGLRNQVQDNARLARQVATQRAATLRYNCEDGNARNRRTVRTLDAFLVVRSKHATRSRRAQLRASRDATIALINALAPVRNCDAVVRRGVGR